MKLLVIKTSSMGDIIHTLPAITDAAQHIPNLHVDWVVEEAFAEIPHWHPAVNNVIPVALRRWRKQPIKVLRSQEWRRFYQQIRAIQYDFVIDAQGLLKSAFLTRLARGIRCGFARQSVREPLASCFYQKSFIVAKQQHAINRLRQLFAAVLNYSFDSSQINYGLDRNRITTAPFKLPAGYCVFITNTSRLDKRWPETNWHELLKKCQEKNISVVLPSGTGKEVRLTQNLVANFANAVALPNGSLTTLLKILAHAKFIVSVDTGLSHLAAALNKPTIVIYGPTNPALIGTQGQQQQHLIKPTPVAVWHEVLNAIR